MTGYDIISQLKLKGETMAFKMTKNGKVVKTYFRGKLPKAVIMAVENNPQGDKAVQKAMNIIKNAKVVWDF